MENKGNKSGNIYQKLKGAGAWQSKDSAGPMIKGVGIKSPLNMGLMAKINEDSKKIADMMAQRGKDKKQKAKNAETRKSGKAVSYKDAYADADKKKYKTYDEFEKAAKSYNNKKYNSENPTADAKKAGKTKAQLAKDVADKNKKVTTTNTNTGGGDDDKKVITTEKEVTTTPVVKEVNVAKKTRKEVRLENKAKRKDKRKANQQKRADRIKKEGGTKVGNFLRKGVKKVKEVVKKKEDDSAAKMKKSAMKMKKSAMKMNEGFDKLPNDVQAKIKKSKK